MESARSWVLLATTIRALGAGAPMSSKEQVAMRLPVFALAGDAPPTRSIIIIITGTHGCMHVHFARARVRVCMVRVSMDVLA